MADDDFEMDDDYKEESEFLLKRLQKREEMVQLLKIAHPAKIPQIREYITRLDSVIEQTEKIMQMYLEKHGLEKEAEKQYEELEKTTDKILPELLTHLAEHNPEAHDKFVANLAKIDEENEDEDE